MGLIEGEGTFCLKDPKNMGISFSLALTNVQAPLINAIKNYLDTYLIEDIHLKASNLFLDIVGQRTHLHVKKASLSRKASIEISLRHVNFIVEKLIPMLSGLDFVTKKYMDF